MREIFMRNLNGTFLMPCLHSSLFSLTSIRTSLVPMAFSANFRISLTARGALFLNVIPCNLLWRLMVYSRVTGGLCLAMSPALQENAAARCATASQKTGDHSSSRS